MRIHQLIVLLAFTLFQNSTVYASDEFGLCKSIKDFAPQLPDLPPPLENGAVQLFADQANVDEKQGYSSFKGDVLLQRPDQVLRTPSLTYDRNQDSVNTDAPFTLWDRDFVIQGEKLRLRSQYQGTMEEVTYWLFKRRGHGQAETVTRAGKDLFFLEKSDYSTCDPDNQIWYLRTKELTLNMADEIGTAHHVT
ncbi:MAG: hypothetical protein BWK79_01735, partial [Beggiatoa sp. IS2]